MSILRLLPTPCVVLCTCALVINCGSTARSTAVSDAFPVQGGMRLIPAAGKSFQMGDSAYQNALPVHVVKFTRDYYMDSTEVTQISFGA